MSRRTGARSYCACLPLLSAMCCLGKGYCTGNVNVEGHVFLQHLALVFCRR